VRLYPKRHQAKPGEFLNSEYAKNPLLYAQNSFFRIDGAEYRIGDIVQTESSGIARIDDLHYEPGDWRSADIEDRRPPLSVRVSLFVKPRALAPGLKLPERALADEIVYCPHQQEELSPHEIVSIARFRKPEEKSRAPICRFQLQRSDVDDFSFVPYRQRTHCFTFEAIVNDQAFVYVEAFIDAFNARTSRAHSSTAHPWVFEHG